MGRNLLAAVAALSLIVVTTGTAGTALGAHDPHDPAIMGVFEVDYISATVHAHAPGVHQAVGVVDCAGLVPPSLATLGGACFDLGDFPAGAEFFLQARDDLSNTAISLFAGFDNDDDGCVGCVPGADDAWEGTDSLGGVLPSDAEVLTVFVRTISLEHGNLLLGTVGTLTLTVFEPGTNACSGDGQVVVHDGHRDDLCGQRFDSQLPYLYPCLPDC